MRKKFKEEKCACLTIVLYLLLLISTLIIRDSISWGLYSGAAGTLILWILLYIQESSRARRLEKQARELNEENKKLRIWREQ